MTSMSRIILSLAIAAAFGVAGAAFAVPPEHAGGPPAERGGPPFGNGDFNPGPPETAGNGQEEEEEENENEEENGGPGPQGNGPPGLCGTEGEGPEGQSGRSHVAHLNFSQRDPETGDPLEDGAWGRMMYFWQGPTFDYVFNGHELPAGVEYELTYQPESEGETSSAICLGGGVVNEDGDLHIAESVELDGDLPMPEDANEDGAMLVVVLAEDVDCESEEMLTFLPEDYLFGNSLAKYVDTDFVEEEEGEEEEEEEEEEGGS